MTTDPYDVRSGCGERPRAPAVYPGPHSLGQATVMAHSSHAKVMVGGR